MGPDRVTLPGTAPAPRGVCRQAQGLPPAQEAGWLRGPLARGCGWNVVPGARVLGGARPTPYSRPRRVKPGPGFRKRPYATVCPRPSVPPGKGACDFSARDQVSQDCAPPPIGGQGAPAATTGERPRGPGACQEGRWDRGRGREAESGASGSPAVGGLAGRPGVESLELGKCRGLLQGLLLGLTLAPALEVQVGTAGQARDLPRRPP